MKSGIYLVVLALTLAVACGKKDKGKTTASEPNNNCINQGYCPGGNFPNGRPYPTQNGYYQGFQNGFANGFCGCPAGYFPGYNGIYGLTCLPQSYFGGGLYAMFGWGGFGFGFQAGLNFGTYPNIYMQGNQGRNCYNQVYETCARGNSCSNGLRCVTQGNATLGVCPAGYGDQFYDWD